MIKCMGYYKTLDDVIEVPFEAVDKLSVIMGIYTDAGFLEDLKFSRDNNSLHLYWHPVTGTWRVLEVETVS